MKANTNNWDTVHYQGINISYEFPKLAKYNPPESVILTAMDFFRGVIGEYERFRTPSSSGLGYAFYRSVSRPDVSNLVDISDLITMFRK